MNVSKIKSFFLDNKKSLFYAVFFLFSFFLFSDLAFANGTTGSSALDNNKFIQTAIDVINGLLIIASGTLGLVTALVSLFLTPEWVNGTLFGLDSYMRQIWILVSNIVYFIFAFILILIAFMNIIGKGDKWELKQALPKFIVGVVMVPFTWFFVQFVLSLSAILTVGVLTLPYDTFGGDDIYKDSIETWGRLQENVTNNSTSSNATGNEGKIPTVFLLDLATKKAKDSSGQNTDNNASDEFMQSGGYKTMTEMLEGKGGDAGYKNSVFGIVSIYTYGIMQIDKIDTTNKDNIGKIIYDISDVSLKLLFDAILIIIFLVLMIALFLAVLVRGIWLWIYAMISPAFGLLYFFGKTSEGVGDGENKFSIKEFISLAMVPVYVAAALSFGLLFIMVSTHGMVGENSKSTLFQSCNLEGVSEGGDAECLSVGGFTFGIKAGDTGGNNTVSQSLFARLILQLFGIVILWIAVMAALKQSSITKSITEPIAKFGGSVGSLVAKSPMYAPIIPTGAGGMMSATSLSTAGSTFEGAIRNQAQTKGSDAGNKFAEKFGVGTDSAISEIRNLRLTNDSTYLESTRNLGEYTTKVVDAAGSFDSFAINKPLKKEFQEALEHGFDISEKGSQRLTSILASNSPSVIATGLAGFRTELNSQQQQIWDSRIGRNEKEVVSKFAGTINNDVEAPTQDNATTQNANAPTTITINNTSVNLPNQIVRGADDSIDYVATAEKIRRAIPEGTTINDDIIAQIKSGMTPIEGVTSEDVNNIINVLKP